MKKILFLVILQTILLTYFAKYIKDTTVNTKEQKKILDISSSIKQNLYLTLEILKTVYTLSNQYQVKDIINIKSYIQNSIRENDFIILGKEVNEKYKTNTQVTKLCNDEMTIEVKNKKTGDTREYHEKYDKINNKEILKIKRTINELQYNESGSFLVRNLETNKIELLKISLSLKNYKPLLANEHQFVFTKKDQQEQKIPIVCGSIVYFDIKIENENNERIYEKENQKFILGENTIIKILEPAIHKASINDEILYFLTKKDVDNFINNERIIIEDNLRRAIEHKTIKILIKIKDVIF